MDWITATWATAAGYVLGAPTIWHIEQWWLDRRLWEFRWMYHGCLWAALVFSFMGYGWWGPPVLFVVMLAGGLVVVVTLGLIAVHVLAPIRIRLGIHAGTPAARGAQLKKEIAIEAKRRGIDMNQPAGTTPDDDSRFSELLKQYEGRLHDIYVATEQRIQEVERRKARDRDRFSART